MKAKVIKSLVAGTWILREKTKARPERHHDQGTIILDPPEELLSTQGAQLKDDIEMFKQVIWNHQEEQRLRPIKLEDLMKRLGWSTDRFNVIRYLVRAKRIPSIIEPKPGKFAYKW